MMIAVQEVSDLNVAFPADVSRLMPAWADIPREYQRRTTKWNKLVSDWFFHGLSDLVLQAKPGIDEGKALRHVQAIMGSYEPKHEHKEAACAYLLSEWFEDALWERANKRGTS